MSWRPKLEVLVDMALSPKTVKFLRSLGYEAYGANEFGMGHAKDEEIIKYARERRFYVITADLDFSDILAHSRGPSVIILRLSNPSPDNANR